MKIQSQFTDNIRSFTLQPENPLEECLLKDMADRSSKGSKIDLKALEHTKGIEYRVEMSVNGK